MDLKKINWSDCTIAQYEDIFELIADKTLTSIDFVLEVGDLFFDIPEDISAKELDKLRVCVGFVGTECHAPIKYKDLILFNKLTLAQFIDLDVTLINNTLAECLGSCASKLYGVDNTEDLDEVKVVDVIGAVTAFVKYREDTYRKYPNVFDLGEPDEDYEPEEVEEYEDEEQPDAKEMWLRTIFGLTQGDISKYTHIMGLPHILVFNWVAMSEALKPRQPLVTE